MPLRPPDRCTALMIRPQPDRWTTGTTPTTWLPAGPIHRLASRASARCRHTGPVQLPIAPPFDPMLARLARTIPTEPAGGWLYEPKWDGFRCIVFRDGDELMLTSRSRKPLDRYFPELRAPLLGALPHRSVVDGEIIVPRQEGTGLDFDALSQRIHPAASRVRLLAEQTPAMFVAFDLLALDELALLDRPVTERRRMLLAEFRPGPRARITPASADPELARRWFAEFEGAGLDGIIAKPAEGTYEPGRRALVKVKHERTADCVVPGYRIHTSGDGVGSLLLGLHDEAGVLHHVGVAASFTAARRAQLLTELAPLSLGADGHHPWIDGSADTDDGPPTGRRPGSPSRWTGSKDLSWVPLRIELVAEVTFGQLEAGRFRHGSRWVRWRPDREPASCTYDQLEVAAPVDIEALLAQVDDG